MPCVHEATQHSDWPLLTSVTDRQQILVFLKISINRNCSSVECLSYVPLHRISTYEQQRPGTAKVVHIEHRARAVVRESLVH